MDQILWLAPLQSFAILGAVVAGWSCLRRIVPWPWPRLGGFVFAVAMGSGTIIVMSMPVELLPGVRFDFRNSILAAAALIGGPIMIIAGAIAAAYRIYLGGAGASSGVASIVLATALGIFFHLRGRGKDPSLATMALLSVLAAFGGLLTTVLLPVHTFEKLPAWAFVETTAMRILATFLSAVVLRQDRISMRMAKDNLIYRKIIEALPDSLNVKDREGRFIAANPATARLMQAASAEALSGKTDFDFYPAGIAERFREDEEVIVEARKAVTLEQTATLPDGTERKLVTLKAPLFGSDGEFIGLITHNRDVTETEALKRDLEGARAKLQAAIDNMNDGMAMFGTDGRLIYCNDRYRQLFPLTAHLRVPGARFNDLVSASAEMGEALLNAPEVDAWVTRVAGAATSEAVNTFQMFDGRWLQSRAATISDGLLLLITDITEKRQAEMETVKTAAEYQALFVHSVAGIYRSTSDGRMLRANPALVRLNGYDSETELLERVRDIAAEWYVDPQRREDFKRLMLRDGRVNDFVSEIYRHKSRERIWVSETAWMVPGDDGTTAYFEGTVIEITDRKQAEEEIKRTNVKLLSLAATDGLTGLMNRRSFDEILEREVVNAESTRAPLSLILMDVDNFKSYNDRYGHPQGDECLRFLGRVLKAACRSPSDIACRYGGEELAIILPATTAHDALAVATRLCESVRGLNLRHEASRFGIVTISAGVATVVPNAADTAAGLVRKADEALYAAKGGGRDRVETYAPRPDNSPRKTRRTG
ncbi:MAG: domain S-box/diguanylate cyclase protein [Rhizobium sp.]|nr:domain S-box/diguanylate cyclase protein [Rhizobium sp.]